MRFSRCIPIAALLLLAACGGPTNTDTGPSDTPAVGDVAGEASSDTVTPVDVVAPDVSVDVADAMVDVTADARADTVDAAGDVPADGMFRVPDPGMTPAGFMSWIALPTEDVSSPDRAHVVGVANMSPAYVQANVGANGNAFFVFRTGATLMRFMVNIFPSLMPPGEYVHLHDGAGGIFGAEITPTVSTPGGATWPVMPNHVYVLEYHLRAGGTQF